MISSQQKLTFKENNMSEIIQQENPRKRVGKTRRDTASGATLRNLQNKAARVEWEKNPHSKNSTFPSFSCNGKRNRQKAK